MTIGIPRAFLYYRYHALWITFLEALGCEVVISRPTDKKILTQGQMLAIDEACLSSKVYLGHVQSLIGKCDAILVPRISNFGRREILCTKFEGLFDVTSNVFRDQNVNIIDYNVDLRKNANELSGFLALGKKLGKKQHLCLYAYMMAKQAERAEHERQIDKQNLLLEKDGIKILVVGHSYNVYDEYVGRPVLDALKSLSTTPIIADICDRRIAHERSFEITESLPWAFNRELVGAVQEYRNRVHGMILLSAFPCGPDALVNDILIRRVKDLPTVTLLMDAQEGTAGIETRLESFVDIIRWKLDEVDN